MQASQSSFVQKSNQYRVEIRKQKVSKILALKRIKPQPIQSDNDALQIVIDGVQIMGVGENDEELIVKVLKSIANVFKKYEFDSTHSHLINKVVLIARNIFLVGANHRQAVKEAALELISSLSFKRMYGLSGISLEEIPFEVLTGFNLKMIKSCLLTLSFLLTDQCWPQYFHECKVLLSDKSIFKKFLTIIANFTNSSECFNLIKPLFMNCAVTLCLLNSTFNINPVEHDYRQLLKFCVLQIEREIIEEADKDSTLKAFFERYYQPKSIEDVYEKTYQLSYPFATYELILKIVKQPNPILVQKLTHCLQLQIRAQSVQQPLVRCLSKIYYETSSFMQQDLKEEVFAYIFGLEYSEDSNCLRHMVLMMLNEFVNNQNMNGAIFKYMGDSQHKRWPKTCHFLEVMEFLQIKEDFFTQEKLLQLVDCYLTICGQNQIMAECLPEMKRFGQCIKWLVRNGYILEGIQGSTQFIGDLEQQEWEI